MISQNAIQIELEIIYDDEMRAFWFPNAPLRHVLQIKTITLALLTIIHCYF